MREGTFAPLLEQFELPQLGMSERKPMRIPSRMARFLIRGSFP
jgi:hypothetical protein